jgi:hypothetical protein
MFRQAVADRRHSFSHGNGGNNGDEVPVTIGSGVTVVGAVIGELPAVNGGDVGGLVNGTVPPITGDSVVKPLVDAPVVDGAGLRVVPGDPCGVAGTGAGLATFGAGATDVVHVGLLGTVMSPPAYGTGTTASTATAAAMTTAAAHPTRIVVGRFMDRR